MTERTAWFSRAQEAAERLAARWELTLDSPFPQHGNVALVSPCVWRDAAAVLKIIRSDPDSKGEATALRTWNGRGAIRIFRSETVDGRTEALLLERCLPGSPLYELPEPERDEVVAMLAHTLHGVELADEVPRTLFDVCEEWAQLAEARTSSSGLDLALLEQGIALYRELAHDATELVLLHADLHAGNVLRAERSWLAIDPRPCVGDPTFDVLQHARSCKRLRTNPTQLVDRLAKVFQVDRDRLRAWLFAYCAVHSTTWHPLSPVAAELAPVATHPTPRRS